MQAATLWGGDVIVHVPYQGAAAELIAFLAGQVQVRFDMLSSFQLQAFNSTTIARLPSRIDAAHIALNGSSGGRHGRDADPLARARAQKGH